MGDEVGGKLFGLLDSESCKLLRTVQLVASNKRHSLGINAKTNICSVFNEPDEGTSSLHITPLLKEQSI